MTVKTQPYIAKTSLRGKFMVIQAFLKKQEKSQINNLTYHLKELEKEPTNLRSAGQKYKDQGGNRD